MDATRAALAEHARPVPPVPPVPAEPTFEDVATLYPEGRGRNAAIARDAGVSIRTVQRWSAPAGPGVQRRTFGRSEQSRAFRERGRERLEARRRELEERRREELRRAQRERRQKEAANYGSAARRGLRYRVVGSITVSKPPPRFHVMPADVGGRPNPLRVRGPALEAALELMRGGEDDEAEGLLIGAFFDAYGLPDVELNALEHVGCWRDV